MTLLTLLPAIGLLWLAYRIIRNGFVYPQSKKLNGFGVVGCAVLLWVAYSLVVSLSG
jgi:hypothetical protein